MSGDHDQQSIIDYYNAGREETRLQRGIGLLEGERTREILGRALPPPPGVVYDIGGGAGAYGLWLARLGYSVHLFDLSAVNVEAARAASARQADAPLAAAEVADGRAIEREDGSADAVLVLGPLYHLPERVERVRALREAWRLLKPGGVLAASAISHYGSTLWGLSTFGSKNDFLAEADFAAMIFQELEDGQHYLPQKYPLFLARAFFHLPEELAGEVADAGFEQVELTAVEGPGWIVPEFEKKWASAADREAILRVVRKVEHDPAIMGMSPHILASARKPIN